MQSDSQRSQDMRSDSPITIVGKGHGAMQSQAGISYTRKIPALEELQARSQWVCWRKEQRKGKLTKVPYSPLTGKWAQSDNPQTWASYTQAIQAQGAGK